MVSASHPNSSPPAGRPSWRLVWALACTQLISWGSLYYSFAVLVVPMESELGWTKTDLNGALSLGLLVSGLLSLPIGAWMDRHGGRGVMTLGSIAGGLLLVAWAYVDHLALFYLIWAGLGIVLAAVLYEPAFAVIMANFGTNFRKAITAVMLVGGLASTVFIPLTQWLLDWIGWRSTLLVLAACNLLVCGGIHATMLRGAKRKATEASTASAISAVGRRTILRLMLHSRAFWGVLVCFMAHGATFSALIFHIIPLLSERGVGTATIISCVAIIGPMQVARRIVLLLLGPRLTVRQAGAFATVALPCSILILIFAPPDFLSLVAFAAFYGAGNGVMTIVRGTVVPDLLTKQFYATINGAIALVSTVARALAPFAAAAAWVYAGGYDAVLWILLVGAGLSGLGFLVAVKTGTREPNA